jgi:DUF4097 and DUF4098 domain-containing protein YvlB
MKNSLNRLAAALLFMCAVSLLIAPAGLAQSPVATERFERNVPLKLAGAFSLKNINGSVSVEAWERDVVEIRAIKSAYRDAADLARVQISLEQKAGEVAVRTVYPEKDGVEVSVEYRVRVPYRVLLRNVETVNGAVRVRGVDGRGSVSSVNGNIEIADVAGRFSARTTNGNIEMEYRQLPDGEPVSIETVNGSVLLALPESADAELDVRSMNGDFRSELPMLARGSIGPRDYHGRLGRGGGAVRVRTVNGGIRVVASRPTI